jgi:hypothetical protein
MTARHVAPRVTLTEGSGFVELAAFDHFAAWSCSFQTNLLLSGFGGIGAIYIESFRTHLLLTTVGCVALVFLLSRGYRIVVEHANGETTVTQKWLGFRYRTLRFDRNSERVEVAGTGDWGFPGDWPISELCELKGAVRGTRKAVFVGPASACHDIARTLREQIVASRDGRAA